MIINDKNSKLAILHLQERKERDDANRRRAVEEEAKREARIQESRRREEVWPNIAFYDVKSIKL